MFQIKTRMLKINQFTCVQSFQSTSLHIRRWNGICLFIVTLFLLFHVIFLNLLYPVSSKCGKLFMAYCVIAKHWCSCVCVGEVAVNMKPKQHQLMWSQQCFQEYFTSSVTHDIITVSTMNLLSAG